MAIWQVNLNFKIQKELDFFNTDFNNSIQALSNVLPETTSWSDSIKQYGLLDSTCIEILLDKNNHVEEITLRLDLINFSLYELECLCEFAIYNNFLMEYENELYTVNKNNFIKIIQKSDALKFLENPQEFLNSLKTDNI